MSKILVQEYLRSGKSLDDLKKEHGVDVSPHNGKISFNYNQIDSKTSDKLANQCRGLILREKDLDIVAFPFERFLNHSEGHAAKINWDTAKFEDKLDGSLCIIHFDKEQMKWHVATRKMCEGQGVLHDSGKTFAEFIDMTAKEMGHGNLNDWLEKLPKEYKEYTFMMEFCSPYNQIVCHYEKMSLTLLGVRNNYTFKEYCPTEFNKDLGINIPKVYSFDDFNHMLQVIKEWSPKEKEGVVIKDDSFNRVKVKNPSYVAYNRLHDSLTSWRACAEIILLGKDDDVISILPNNVTKRIKKLKPVISELIHRTEQDWKELKNIEDRKEFALGTKGKIMPAALFYLKENPDKTILDFLSSSKNKQENGIPTSKLKSIIHICEKIDPDSVKD